MLLSLPILLLSYVVLALAATAPGPATPPASGPPAGENQLSEKEEMELIRLGFAVILSDDEATKELIKAMKGMDNTASPAVRAQMASLWQSATVAEDRTL